MTTSYTTKTWKSKTSRRWCGSAVVGVGSLWRSGHAFRDLVKAVADDLVDLLLACGEVECRWEGVWRKLSKLCADLLG